LPEMFTTLYVRTKTAKNYQTSSEIILSIGGRVTRFPIATGVPDLAYYDVTVSTGTDNNGNEKLAVEGGIYNVHVTVMNNGTAVSSPATLATWLDYDTTQEDINVILRSKPSKSLTIPKLAPGEAKDLVLKGIKIKTRVETQTEDDPCVSALPILLAIDPKYKITESNSTDSETDTGKSNNLTAGTVPVYRANLEVSGDTFVLARSGAKEGTPPVDTENPLRIGERFDLTFTVANVTTYAVTAPACKATLWFLDENGATLSTKPVKTVSVPKLTQGASKVCVFKNISVPALVAPAVRSVRVVVDTEGKVVGDYFANNAAAIPLTFATE